MVVRSSYFNRFIIWLIAFSIILLACVEEIDLPADSDYRDSLGISAKMTYNNYDEVLVEVTAFNSADDKAVFDDAFNFKEVYIENSSGQRWTLDRTDNGIFRSMKSLDDPDFSLSKTEEFKLYCLLFNGQTIYSDYENVVSGEIEKEVNYTVYPELGNIKEVSASVSVKKSSLKGNYRIYPIETYRFTENLSTPHNDKVCFFRDEVFVDNIILIDGDMEEEELKNLKPYDRFLPDLLRAEGFYVEMVSESLSDGAYQYWSNIKTLLERTGNMFDPAPGALPTNLHNDDANGTIPLGYFYVTEHSVEGKFFSVTDIQNENYFVRLCPIYDPAGNPILACKDCTTLPGASLEVPRYWPEEWSSITWTR